MNDDKYDNLKKKYDSLVGENKYLREKIRKFESQQNYTPSLKECPNQSTQQKQIAVFGPDLKFVNSPEDIDIFGNNPINQYSVTNEKVSLFMSLFKDRNDVYAKKWQIKRDFQDIVPID